MSGDSAPPVSGRPASNIDVAAALLFRRGRVLITQRPAGSHLADLWEFPGGKRETGEDWEACLRRELHEELGIDVTVGALFHEGTFPYVDRTIRLRFYFVECPQAVPKPLGCAALKWASHDELAGHDFPPADQDVVQKLVATRILWEV
jgi:8-oxo-dGTP diphosphatase